MLLVCCLLGSTLATSRVGAQLVLPGAAPSAQKEAGHAGARPKGGGAAPRSAKEEESAAPAISGLAGHSLLLNGKAGLLQIGGDEKSVLIEKLQFAGEGVSDPSQKCVVDIVGEKPIQATSVGRPDGIDRYEAGVPACPFAFDVLDGAALVPSQITACVFKAADCQTAPGGLWGPDGDSLVGDAANIAKERAAAEKQMGKLLHVVEGRAQANEDAANLLRDQSAFPGQRDDACREYGKESIHGYCALRFTQARVALLKARLDALPADHPANSEANKGKKTKKSSGKQP